MEKHRTNMGFNCSRPDPPTDLPTRAQCREQSKQTKTSYPFRFRTENVLSAQATQPTQASGTRQPLTPSPQANRHGPGGWRTIDHSLSGPRSFHLLRSHSLCSPAVRASPRRRPMGSGGTGGQSKSSSRNRSSLFSWTPYWTHHKSKIQTDIPLVHRFIC